jgi:hypothetical protein
MQKVNEFVETVRLKSDVLLKQKDDLDVRIRNFLGIIDRAVNEINDLGIESAEDITVGDIKPAQMPDNVHPVKISPDHAYLPEACNESPEIVELIDTKVCPGCNHVHFNRGKYCSAQCSKREQNRRYRDKLAKEKDDKKKAYLQIPNRENIIKNLRKEMISCVEGKEKSIRKSAKHLVQEIGESQKSGNLLRATSSRPVTFLPIDPDQTFTPDPEPSYDSQD